MLSREYKAILIIEQIFLIGSYPWITWLGGYLIQYIESTVVAKVMDFFLGNIFEWNLSEMEGRRSFTRNKNSGTNTYNIYL